PHGKQCLIVGNLFCDCLIEAPFNTWIGIHLKQKGTASFEPEIKTKRIDDEGIVLLQTARHVQYRLVQLCQYRGHLLGRELAQQEVLGIQRLASGSKIRCETIGSDACIGTDYLPPPLSTAKHGHANV